MAKRIKLSLILSLLSVVIMAQEKKSFTLNDLLPGGNTFYSLQAKNMHTTWWGDQCVETTVEACYLINPKNGEKNALFTLEQMNKWLQASHNKPIVRSCASIKFPYPDLSLALIETPRKYYLVDFKEETTVWTQDLPEGITHVEWNAASRNVAYNRNHNLYVTDAHGKEIAVSNDGSHNLVYGQSVHRDEFGITKGTFWSPDGKLLAFYRMDQSMVPDYPQVDISTRIASTYSCKYPMAGENMHKVSVGVFNPATRKTIWLQTADPTNRYFTNITWSPDGKSIYMIELNRDQNEAELIQYSAETGKRQDWLYGERHPKYVEPQVGLLFLPWDSSKFIYQSQRDGYKHLYLFDLKKNQHGDWLDSANGGDYWETYQVTQLTAGEWVVKDILGFDIKDKSIIIGSNELHPLQTNLFKVKIPSGKRTLLGDKEGVHYGKPSTSGNYLVDYYTSPTVVRKVNLITTTNGKNINLLTAEDPWREYNVPEITSGSIKAADGVTNLYYRMVKPVDFDPNKKYPTIVYVYGGPHAHNIEASRNYYARGWEIYMAQKGYLMFILDNRGSEHRGLAFENVTFRQLGVEEMKDQIEGVKFLKSLPYVDDNRLGVHGWSYGGFMTTNLMLSYPEVFKVGVAGGPVIDWNYYEVMYGERYMDHPKNNPEGYKGSNLRLKAPNLKGKLQIIIGYNDPVCVPQHSLSFLRACIDAGKQVDFFVYPGDEHNMFGQDRIHLHERITQYFEDYLK